MKSCLKNDKIYSRGDNVYKLPLSKDLNDVETLKLLSNANNRIGELKGILNQLPNPKILLNAITLGEAKDSSEIENIVTTYDEIYKEMTSSSSISANAKEVLRYRKAISLGFEELNKNGFISIRSLINIQDCIESNKGGIRKLPGTVIKNTKTGEIVHTPPQSEKEILDYLANLEKYINNENEYDPLINMGLIHYQFETIHPFYDGNGRTGRILNVLYLVMMNKLSFPVLYLSRYIIQNKDEYYTLLKECNTDEENIRKFVRYMLKGIIVTSNFTIQFISEIVESMEQTTVLMKERLPKIYSKELVEYLYYEFYTKNEFLRNELNISRSTANKYLKSLEEAGFLVSEKVGKEVIYKNVALFNLMEKW